jgi:hypothetical protein
VSHAGRATVFSIPEQHPQGTAYVIEEAGLTTALHERGYVLSDRDPAAGPDPTWRPWRAVGSRGSLVLLGGQVVDPIYVGQLEPDPRPAEFQVDLLANGA